jgi:5-methylcytosine-specific restriction endonuclease McrA
MRRPTCNRRSRQRMKGVEDLWLAVHEAAHALVALKLGDDVAAVTIRDRDRGGSCWSRPKKIPRTPSLEEMPSLLLWPSETRAFFERRLAVVAAGEIATTLYAPVRTGYRPAPEADVERDRIARELDAAGFRWLVDESVPEPPLERRSDEAKAVELSRLGVSDVRLSQLYAQLVVSDLTRWIGSEAFHRALAAIVRELLRYGTLSGEAVCRIVARVDQEIREEVERSRRNAAAVSTQPARSSCVQDAPPMRRRAGTDQPGPNWASTRRWRRIRANMIAAAVGRPCPICRRLLLRGQRFHLDHKVARVYGGADLDPRNLQIVHAECNLRKGRGEPPTWATVR